MAPEYLRSLLRTAGLGMYSTPHTPADDALVSSAPRLQVTVDSCRSCKASLLLRRMGNG